MLFTTEKYTYFLYITEPKQITLHVSESSDQTCGVQQYITFSHLITILFFQKPNTQIWIIPPRFPLSHCVVDNTCMLSLTPCISNYTAAPSRSVLTIPTCCTAECPASKWDCQEISHWSHLDILTDSTGGNNHSRTAGNTKHNVFSYSTYI